MPKIPDDMSDEATARRAVMTKQSRVSYAAKAKDKEPLSGSEIERIAASLGLEGGQIFICQRGR